MGKSYFIIALLGWDLKNKEIQNWYGYALIQYELFLYK